MNFKLFSVVFEKNGVVKVFLYVQLAATVSPKVFIGVFQAVTICMEARRRSGNHSTFALSDETVGDAAECEFYACD